MAWKFENPWGGGNAQNPWDINGAEAQKVLGIINDNVLKNNTTAQDFPGIYIDNLDDEGKLKIFVSKIQEYVPKLVLKYVFNKNAKKGKIYVNEGTIDNNNPIEKSIHTTLSRIVQLRNDFNVSFYDEFKGDTFQLINIDHYNSTTQYEYFAYALTHLFREYLWAVELKITPENVDKAYNKEYQKAHGRTLLQDLEIYSYFAKRKNKDWSWWEDLNSSGFLSSYSSLIDKGTKIFREEYETNQSPSLYLLDCMGNKSSAPVKIVYIEFINIKSWNESLNDMDKVVTYDKILF